jgi:uncharacterized protein DUF1905
VHLRFAGTIWEWRGPAPYFFVTVPEEESAEIQSVSALATYGWGVIPVQVAIGKTVFETSLFPKDGAYLVPLKAAVRASEQLETGNRVHIDLTVRISS